MKKTLFALAVMFTSITLSASATSSSTTVANASPGITVAATAGSFDFSKFEGIVVEQTITFDNGKKAVVFYKVEDGCIAVYSQTDISRYSLNDLLNVKESKERKVSAVKGKRYGKYTFAQAKRIATKWLGI